MCLDLSHAHACSAGNCSCIEGLPPSGWLHAGGAAHAELQETAADILVLITRDGQDGPQKNSALMHAAEGGHANCARLLLAHSPEAQMAAADSQGWSALMFAAKEGHSDCVRLLLAHSPETYDLAGYNWACCCRAEQRAGQGKDGQRRQKQGGRGIEAEGL